MKVRDATGSSRGARVNIENRLDVESVVRPIEQHINEKYHKIFSLPFDAIDPVGADDYFVYFKNTGTKDLHFVTLRIRSTVIGTVEIHSVTGTAVFAADTDITPVNRSVGNTSSISATIKTDTNTTGLTNAGILAHVRLAVANTDYNSDVESHIIVPPGQAIALLWDTATGALSGTACVYEDQGVI